MIKFSNVLETIIFGARWLLAPLYLGLAGALVLLVYRYGEEFYHTVTALNQIDEYNFTLNILGLLDLVLIGNLIVIVMFAGYENFVSRFEVAQNSIDRPHWMGTIDFSGLKLKLIGSLVAFSVIELLKDFIHLSENHVSEVPQSVMWRVIIHLTFVVSGVLFSVSDWVAENRLIQERKSDAFLHGKPPTLAS